MIGSPNLASLLTAYYQCGHCTSETDTRTDESGLMHVVIHHDDGCPVLNGHVSALGDVLRAAIPDTFRP
ncbi:MULTISPECIES: hypothetical protein [Streptomyces]|uniref:Uncharacterized protein n=1 Tax=Streptomyces dengpaensis TaxID=2049881 RepID=A0ABM6SSQ1_9ACTN|nr:MULTISPECIES: hypothetical protein [Streptomyces]AVH57773.1 hypothetical protein C4B68_20605 [Streptomyces dengpaensis]PIB03489.1 hypothetical protein B1C81_36965 [Streptomyces sp. HG99]